MKVVIESHDEGICWKLLAIQSSEALASSLIYFPSVDTCLQDLRLHARNWKTHLPERTVSTVGEVKVYINGVDGKNLGDLWPDLQ